MKTDTVLFEDIIAHPNPVHLADLLTDIQAVIQKHVVRASLSP